MAIKIKVKQHAQDIIQKLANVSKPAATAESTSPMRSSRRQTSTQRTPAPTRTRSTPRRSSGGSGY